MFRAGRHEAVPPFRLEPGIVLASNAFGEAEMAVQHLGIESAIAPAGRGVEQKKSGGRFSFLKNLSISRQFALLCVLAIAICVLCIGYTMLQIRTEMMEQKRSQIRSVVEAGSMIVRGYVEKAKAGQVPEDEAKKMALEAVGAMRFDGVNYVFVSTFDGVTIAHPNPALIGKDQSDSRDENGKYFARDIAEAGKAGSGFVDYMWVKPGEKEATPKVTFVVGIPEWRWSVGGGLWVDDVDAAFWRVVLGLTKILVPAIALMLVVIYFSSRNVSKLLSSSVASMSKIAAGDLAVEVGGRDRGDEIGAIARAVQVFKDNSAALVQADHYRVGVEAEAVLAKRREEEENHSHTEALGAFMTAFSGALRRLSNGEFNFRLNEAFSPEYETLRQDMNASVEKLQTLLQSVSLITGSIQSGTQEISSASNDLSRRTEQQAASLEETAAALDEITATVKKAAEGASHARQVVASAKDEAGKSGGVVNKAVQAMSGIEKSSQEISQIIGVIDEIAFQTNLLALNAGVEAARAGDAGRGFAVVASEVRALAQRSAGAAKEIKGLISTSAAQVSQGVALVAESGKSLERIMVQVAEIDTVVTEIAAGAREQATGLDEVNIAVNQMDQVTQQNAAMAEQSSAASRSLSQEAGQLASLIGQFKVSDESASASVVALEARARGKIKSAAQKPDREPAEARPARRELRTAPGRQAAATMRKPDPAAEGWEEF
jgi:methyl-accepting chemotaxis protein